MASRETLDPRLYVWMKEWKLIGYHTQVYSEGGVLVGQRRHSSLAWVEVRPAGLKSAPPRWRIAVYVWCENSPVFRTYTDLDDALDAASEFLRDAEKTTDVGT